MRNSFLRSGIGALTDLFYPPHCGLCGVWLPDVSAASGLCPECLSGVIAPPAPCCPVCSHALTGLCCPNCEGRSWHLGAIVAASSLGERTSELIHRFKYGRERWLAPCLGTILLRALEDPRIRGRAFDAVVPVPLHPRRERDRGFNQAECLARRIAPALGIPVRRWLRRIRETAPQARSARSERMRGLEGAFAARLGIGRGKSVLLVDDVCTTGATLDSCASALVESGVPEVRAVVVARG